MELDIRIQAEQFLDYFSKLKGENLNDAFRFWAEGKDFDEETKRTIRMEVNTILKGGASDENA